MIREFSYTFDELRIKRSEITSLMGYQEDILPEPFNGYLNEAYTEATDLCDIKGAVRIVEKLNFSNNELLIDDVAFKMGKTIVKELRDSTSGMFFICTAGKRISEKSKQLLLGEDPVLGYVYDILGSVIVETAMDLIHEQMKLEMETKGLKVTNRYSPGYCKWHVEDQHSLFSFFPTCCCGITLSPSALMEPIKSVSGFIGTGHTVRFRQHTCSLCNQPDCIYRKLRKVT